MSNPTTYIRIGMIALLLLSVVGYALFQTRNLIHGPEITIHSPKNGETLANPLVAVEGTARNISFISLNDRQIFIDENGKFKESLLLSFGYNIMTVRAQDKFGRERKEILELMYKNNTYATSTSTSNL